MFQRLRAFARSDRGNVAMIFGLSIIPVIGLAGAAIDYSGAARDRSTLQSALDAGTLAGSKVLATGTQAEARAVAESYIRANLPERMRSIPLTIAVVNNGQSVSASAATTHQNGLLPVIGITTLPVTGSSIAQAPSNRRIEAVLALDNTGSMAQSGKMDALRAATLEFLSILENSGRPAGDVRVGVVPFNTVVRLDPAVYRNASWLRNISGQPWSVSNVSTWGGCVIDRDTSGTASLAFNVLDTAPVSSTVGTLFPRASCDWTNSAGYRFDSRSLAALQPLTSDFAVLRNVVNAMTPVGATNVTLGVAWGWHLITPNAPFTESAGPANTNTDRWLVVLTDGDNTQDRWDTEYGTSAQRAVAQTNIDARTQAVCGNIRLQDPRLRVLTIRVIDGNATLLRNCASNPSDYYEVTSSSQIVEVFRRIAWQISSLRLTN
jgi:Flp pilus assembly protein TadG